MKPKFPTIRELKKALTNYIVANRNMFRLQAERRDLRDIANSFYARHENKYWPLSELDVFDVLSDVLGGVKL